jgi:hypothetical protein
MKKQVTFTLEINDNAFDVAMNYLGRERYICCGNNTADNLAWALRRIMVEAARLAHNIDTRNDFLAPVFNEDALAIQTAQTLQDAKVYLD